MALVMSSRRISSVKNVQVSGTIGFRTVMARSSASYTVNKSRLFYMSRQTLPLGSTEAATERRGGGRKRERERGRERERERERARERERKREREREREKEAGG